MKKIVLWYDDVDNLNCFNLDDSVYSQCTVVDFLKQHNIAFVIKYVNYDDFDRNDNNIYVIELLNVYSDTNVFDSVSNNAFELFRKGLKILLYYPREGHRLEKWLSKLHRNIKEKHIDNKKVFLLFGDLDFEKTLYRDYITNHNITNTINPLSIDFFCYDYFKKVDTINDDLNYKREYNFLSYNAKLRPHRLLTVFELVERNLIDNALVSFMCSTHTGDDYSLKSAAEILKEHGYKNKKIKEYVKNWKPLQLDMFPDDIDQNNLNNTIVDHYRLSYFSLITEGSLDSRFITEKTYKAIYNLHPFIIIGPFKFLELLKEKGYKTFPELFDESYDNEKDHIKRILMVIDQVEKFVNLSKKEKQEKFELIKEKLLFNKSIYLQNANNNDVCKIFEQIGNTNVS